MSLAGQRKEKIKYFLFLFWSVSFLCFLVFIPRLSLPIGLAYVIALLSRPIYSTFLLANPKKKILYILSLIILLILLSIPLVIVVQTFVNELGQINEYLPKIDSFIKEKVFQIKVFLFEKFKYKTDFDPSDFIFSKLQRYSQKALLLIPTFIGTLFEWMILVPLFFIFFLTEKNMMKEGLFKLVPNGIFERVYILADQFNTKFVDYIFAKCLEASIVGFLISLGLSLIGFPYAILLGTIGGITNILPYLGPILGLIPAVGVFVISGLDYSALGMMLLVFLVANLIDIILVFPLMVSKIVNLNPILVIVSVIVGSQLGGVLGMILSVPITAFLKLLFNEVSKEIYS